jgi:uncharacterized membrane protein (DUF485 family)
MCIMIVLACLFLYSESVPDITFFQKFINAQVQQFGITIGITFGTIVHLFWWQ